MHRSGRAAGALGCVLAFVVAACWSSDPRASPSIAATASEAAPSVALPSLAPSATASPTAVPPSATPTSAAPSTTPAPSSPPPASPPPASLPPTGDPDVSSESSAERYWSVPFLSRPMSGPIRKKGGCDDLVIEGRTFRDLGEGVEAIHLEHCKNVTIRANDFAHVAQAITVIDSTNVRIEWNRYLDILGPHKRAPGKHRANFVQLSDVHRGVIAHNKGKGGDTEDIVSLYRTGGTAKHPFIIEYNHFQGGDWTSRSGSGIALGDATSSHSIARYNVLLDPGQAGIFIAGGTDHKIIGNTILGRKRKHSNVGIYVWNQSEDRPCSDNVVRDNVVSWTKGDGSKNPKWDAGNCGRIKGWTDNKWRAKLDADDLEVTL